MSTIALEVTLPEDVFLALQSAGLSRSELSAQAARNLAVQLYAEGRLSLGKAARLASLSLSGFWWLLEERGVPVVDYTEDDYMADRDALRRLAERGAGAT